MASNTVADVFKVHKQRRDRKTTLNLLALRSIIRKDSLPPLQKSVARV